MFIYAVERATRKVLRRRFDTECQECQRTSVISSDNIILFIKLEVFIINEQNFFRKLFRVDNMATKRNFLGAKLNARLKDHISQVKHILFSWKELQMITNEIYLIQCKEQ